MKYSNSFGKKSSKILLGTAYFGDTISKESAFEIMDTYFACGGCHIDTARLYAGGESEKVISEWIRTRKPQELFLSTKGAFPLPETPKVPRVSEKEVRHDLDLSLRALQVDVIEFYWLHRDDETVEAGEIIEFMNALVKEGKIKHFGASNWRINRIEEANKYASEHALQGFEASQIRFSPAVVAPEGNADRDLVDMCPDSFEFYKKAGIPVAAYASQAKGFFSKIAEKGIEALNEKSRSRYLWDENFRRLEIIKALAEKYNTSVGAMVCAALSSIETPDVFPIIGGSRKEQIIDSMSASDLTLQKEELLSLFKFNF